MSANEVITEIIIPLLSAILSGAITLIGVILTIYHTNKINKQESIEKYKPIIRCYYPYDYFDSDNAKNVSCIRSKELSCKNIYGNFTNTDKANFSISGIRVDGIFYETDINPHIKKSEDFIFDIQIPEKNKINNIELEILDDYNRKYVYELDFSVSNLDDVYIFGIKEKLI